MDIVCNAIKTLRDETMEAVQNILPEPEITNNLPGLDNNTSFITEFEQLNYNTGYYSTSYNNTNIHQNDPYGLEKTNEEPSCVDQNNTINTITSADFLTQPTTNIIINTNEFELEKMLTKNDDGGGDKCEEQPQVVTDRLVTCVENVYDYDKLHPQTRNDMQQCFKLINEQNNNMKMVTEMMNNKDRIIEKKVERERKWQLVLSKMQHQNEQLMIRQQKSTCEQNVQTELSGEQQEQHFNKVRVSVKSVEQQTKVEMTDKRTQTNHVNDTISLEDHMDMQQKHTELQDQYRMLKDKHVELIMSEDKNRLKRHAVEQTLVSGFKKFKNSVLESFDEMETRQKMINDQKATIQKLEQTIAELRRQNGVLLDSYRRSKDCVNTVNSKLIQSQNVVEFYKNECATLKQKLNSLQKK